MKANPIAVRAARGSRISAAIVSGATLFLAVFGLSLAFEGTACAQQWTWTGLGSDSQWTTAENWDPVGVPHPNLGDTQYTMAGTTRLDPTVAQIYVINKITYDNTAGAFIITNSSAFWVGSGGFLNNSTSTQTVNSTINLFASQTWNAAAGDMMFTDVVMLFGSSKLLTVDGANDVTVTGDFSGQAGVRKQGAGTLLFSGTNTYSTGTTVEAGILRAGSLTALPQNTNYTVNGGTLDLNDFELTATQLDGTGGTIDLGFADLIVDQAADTTFAGVITGPGTLWKAGAGNLTLTGPNIYTGDTIVIAGTLTGTTTSVQGFIDNDALVVFDQEFNGTYAEAIVGTGDVTKEGSGTANFTGTNTYTGTTTVSAGALAINGSITSDTTVAANGTLAGSGTITGDVVVNGTMSAGNSIGTFGIIGTYSSTAGSVTEVEIAGAGTVPGVNVDLVAATGAATIDGTVNVLAGPGSYSTGTQYTFLTGSTVTGTYDGINDDLAFLDAVLGYTAGSAYFTFVGDYSSGSMRNTVNVGDYLNEISPGATGDLQTLLDELNQVSEADANFALEQLTGAVYGSTAQIGVQNTSIYLQALARRLRSNLYDGDGSLAAQSNDSSVVLVSSTRSSNTRSDEPLVIRGQCCRPKWNTWATGFGLGGNADSDGNAAALDYSMGGTLVGLETMSGTHLLGFYGGYLGNYVGTDANESAKINGGTFGSYYVGRDDNQYYIVAGGFEFDGYESRRRIAFADDTAFGETDVWKGYSYAERGATFGNRLLAVQPFAAAQYIYLRQNGFTETGAAGANLAVPGIDTHSLRSIVGARLYGAGYSRSSRSITPEVRGLWLHEFLDTTTGFETFFSEVGGGSAFSINGLGLGRDWALVGTGLNCELGSGWSTYADYDLMINDQTTFHIGSCGVMHNW